MIRRGPFSVGDLVLAVLVVATIGIMLIPMPPLAIDFLVATNLALSVVLLLVATYVRRTLDLSTFPAIILITTLFRLAINISSTRRLLLDGDPGSVIKAFGSFVVSGSVIVGAVVFLILTVVQFLVIAKGAERAAEVSARFTLDALPGRQMAIEADLRSGFISAAEATARRSELKRESQLFSSLEGAMKFVKGDAIASLVIIATNILGGLGRGVVQLKMPLGDALNTYTLLTIGDGLVSQVPALLITTAAGIVMTRVDSAERRGTLGQDIGLQLLQTPKSLWVATGMLIGLALIPGLPMLPFLVVGAICALLAASRQHLRRIAMNTQNLAAPSDEVSVDAGGAYTPLVLAHGPLSFAQHRALHSSLLAVVTRQRDAFGLPAIALALRPAPLGPGQMQLLVKGVPTLDLPPIDGATVDALRDQATPGAREFPETVYGPGYTWLPDGSATAAEPMAARLEQHLAQAVQRHLTTFMNPQVAKTLLDTLALSHDAVVRDLRSRVSDATMSKVFTLLLDEAVPLSNLLDLALAVADWSAQGTQHHVALSQRAREAVGANICQPFNSDGTIRAVALDWEIQDLLRSARRDESDEGRLSLDADLSEEIGSAIRRAVHHAQTNLVVAPRDLRYALKRHFFADQGDLHIIADSEIPFGLSLSTVETTSLSDAG